MRTRRVNLGAMHRAFRSQLRRDGICVVDIYTYLSACFRCERYVMSVSIGPPINVGIRANDGECVYRTALPMCQPPTVLPIHPSARPPVPNNER